MKKFTRPIKIGATKNLNECRCVSCINSTDGTFQGCQLKNQKKVTQNNYVQTKNVQSTTINTKKKEINKKPNINGLQDINQNLGGPKNPRFHKEPEIEMYKKIADNANKKQTYSDMNKLEGKNNTKLLRNPAQFNEATFIREYGSIPK